ncbi:MAG: hypothetical protein JRH20_07190 [Deltaproteobacteria bacterium]|nr:hypothetical protein [Deltaproteobacteria bacterium]
MREWKGMLTLFTTLTLLVGCSSVTRQRPADVLRAYAKALEQQEYERAYEMMNEAFRKQHKAKEFANLLRSSPEAGRRLAKELKAARKVALEARFSYGKGSQLRLVAKGGGVADHG